MFRKTMKKPVEKQKTAAWADMKKISRATNVSKPDLAQTMNAKQYVDENEK
jgi:hypothetical protein